MAEVDSIVVLDANNEEREVPTLLSLEQLVTIQTGALTETAPATDTAPSGLNGRLQRIAQRLTSLIALVPASLGSKADAASLAVTKSTEDKALTGALSETAPASDTASSGLNGRLQRIAQRLSSLIALVPTALGQGTMATSFKVVLPSDQSAIPVSGNTTYIDVTLSLDTSQYGIGDVLADTQVVTNAMRVNDGTGVLQSVTVIDQDDQKAAFYIYLLSANVVMGTENSLPSISDTNALQILGPPIAIAAADYFDLGGASVAGKDGLAKVVKPATGTRDLYVAVVNGSGTPTFTAAGIKLRLGFLLD